VQAGAAAACGAATAQKTANTSGQRDLDFLGMIVIYAA
jgi:hypothetical protein